MRICFIFNACQVLSCHRFVTLKSQTNSYMFNLSIYFDIIHIHRTHRNVRKKLLYNIKYNFNSKGHTWFKSQVSRGALLARRERLRTGMDVGSL